MSKVAAHPTGIWIDQFAISGFLNQIDLALKQETAPVTCFQDAGPRRVVGNYDHSHKLTAFFDGASGAWDDIAFNSIASDADHYLCESWGANAKGALMEDSIVELAQRPHTAKVGAAMLLSADLDGRGHMARGHIIDAATLTTATTGVGTDDQITTTGQIYAVVFRLTGAVVGTSVTLKVQDSADNVTFADIAGLATSGALTVATAVRVTTTTATRRYKRLVSTGTFTSAPVVVTGGYVLGS